MSLQIHLTVAVRPDRNDAFQKSVRKLIDSASQLDVGMYWSTYETRYGALSTWHSSRSPTEPNSWNPRAAVACRATTSPSSSKGVCVERTEKDTTHSNAMPPKSATSRHFLRPRSLRWRYQLN